MEVAIQIREIRGESRETRPRDYGLRNSLARRQRRLYRSGAIDATAAEFDLTYGEAKGVIYAEASRNTIDKCLKAGGWGLVIELASDLLGESLDSFIARERSRLHGERQRAAEADRRLLSLARNLSAGDDLGGL